MKSRLLALFSAVVGLALLVYVVQQTGVGEIWAGVRRLGLGFLLVLLISSSRYLSRAAAWLRCIPRSERRVGFWTLWRSRLAGEAIGDLTFGPVVAEPLRLVALGDRLPLTVGLQSLAVENIAYTVSSCLMVMAGAVALLARFGLTGSLRDAMTVALTTVVVAVAAAVIVISRRWPLASLMASHATALLLGEGERRRWIAAKIDHLREIENYVFDFYARRPTDFFVVALCELGFHAAGVLEIYTTLRLIGVDLTLATAFLLEAVNRAINIAFIFVPALVGVDELLTKLVTETLQLGGAAGVTLAIIRKIRMFFWIAVGVVFLSLTKARTRRTEKENAKDAK